MVHCAGVTTIVARLRGLPAGTSVVLRDNGADDLTLDANGDYPFSSRLTASATYEVTVLTQPQVGSCAPVKGSGTAGSGGTITVVVDCIAGPANSSTVGVKLLRLPAGKSVVLQNNGGNDLQLTRTAHTPSVAASTQAPATRSRSRHSRAVASSAWSPTGPVWRHPPPA